MCSSLHLIPCMLSNLYNFASVFLRMGRDMAYDCWSCDLLCAASSADLYRINLEQGRFLSSLSTQSPALNIVCRSKLHGLVACGGEDGAVECFDMRIRSSVGRIDAVAPVGNDQEVTALAFDDEGGFTMAVGSSAGKVLLYDLRSSHPIQVKDHMYGSPILDIKWHRTLNMEQQKLITTDNHIVRIWDPETGDGMTSIEPTAGKINDICVFSHSGLMLLALDCSQIPFYFVPSLGPAPKWCSVLELLTVWSFEFHRC
uniref:Nucleolar protein 10 n=1 Tax=Rhizophora mucronata TaxID=61149 RepID=A0A2P2KSM1_RHIMU